MLINTVFIVYFNPQGSREPRPFAAFFFLDFTEISIHKALASLDSMDGLKDYGIVITIHKALASLDADKAVNAPDITDFNPQGSREPRPKSSYSVGALNFISIHKALASLDQALR